MPPRQDPRLTDHARELRIRQTDAESLLWAVLRSRRLGGLKFRRQLPIGPFVVDFACVDQKLIIEIDGEYHDYVVAEDLARQRSLEALGWRLLRFSNDDVLQDAETVAVAICLELKRPPPGEEQAREE